MDETAAPHLVELTVAQFSDSLASAEAVPGGGAAAALGGALGAALVAMVARLTAGRARYAEHDAEMRQVCAAADELRARLLAMVDADADAYQAVMHAYQMPREAEDRRAGRSAAIQTALRRATEAALETAGLCLEVVTLAAAAAARGNRNATCDAAVAALLAHAGLQGAARNVRANLVPIREERFRASTLLRSEEIELAGQTELARALHAAGT